LQVFDGRQTLKSFVHEFEVREGERRMAQMKAALEEIREKAAIMNNGGAWAAGIAALCLSTLENK